MSAPASRWVLRHRGAEPSAADLARIRDAAGLRVLEAEGRVLLVAAAERTVRALVAQMPGWTVVPESATPPSGA